MSEPASYTKPTAEEMEAFIRDIAEHGLRTDLNPTSDYSVSASDMYTRLTTYFKESDARLRRRAARLLGESY